MVDRWSDIGDDFSETVYWLANPIVQRRFQERIVDGSGFDHWINFCADRFLAPARRILSVGCGDGGLERHLHGLLNADFIDGVDISPARIETARRAAEKAGLSSLRYFALNVETNPFPEPGYDAIIFDSSLHHVFDVDAMLRRVAEALAPGGILVVNEYIGPNRFRLSAREQQILDSAWLLMPERFRRSCAAVNRGDLQPRASYPDPLEVERVDPSECVQSEEIMPRLREHFEISYFADRGGSLLQFLLANIAGNFREDDETAVRLLKSLFALEDILTASGDLGVHFALIAARPKPRA